MATIWPRDFVVSRTFTGGCTVDREEYRSLLGQLPVKSPSPGVLAAFCPHLSREQAVEAFLEGDGYVAVPPLLVAWGHHVLHYSGEWVEEVKVWREGTRVVTGTKNHPTMLHWAFSKRTLESYSDGKPHGDVFHPSPYMEEAMEFAEQHWGDRLILDDWVDVGEFIVQDPTDLVTNIYFQDQPRTKAVVRWATSRAWNEIHNDHSRPESVQIDEALVQLTLDRFIGAELKGGRGGYTDYNCANCGSGLGLHGCSGCGHWFRDNHMRCGWDTPLPAKVVELLRQSGHTFSIDPSVAWEREKDLCQ